MLKKIFVILGFAIFLSLNRVDNGASLAYGAVEVDENIRAFLTNLESAIYKMDTYRCIMLSENWKGKRHEKKVLRFQFKRPNLMRTDVLQGRKRGSSVVLNKEGKIRGRNSIGFRKTLRPTDKRLRNIRGYTFMNSSLLDKLGRLKEHILKRGCRTTISEEEYDGSPAYHIRISHEDPDDAVTIEDIWFDKKTYIILKNLKYEGEEKVTETTWQEFEVNIPLDDGLFEQ